MPDKTEPAKPPQALVRLLHEAPGYFRRVQHGLNHIEIYDDALAFIAANRSDDFAEWDHLAAICRQDKALLLAMSRVA